jgi:hypothetical protein
MPKDYSGLVENPKKGRWTDEEVSVLLRTDITTVEIAVLLNRDYKDVVKKRMRFKKNGGINRKPGAGTHGFGICTCKAHNRIESECSFEGCDRPAVGYLGYCKSHAQQNRNTGTVTALRPVKAWSQDEIDFLIANANLPHADIAKALGRTTQSINLKKFELYRDGVLEKPKLLTELLTQDEIRIRTNQRQSERYYENLEENRRKAREWGRKWNRDNPDKVAEKNQKHYDPEKQAQAWKSWADRNRPYIQSQDAKSYEKKKSLVQNPRTGRWTDHEIAILLRTDITVKEMACILQRSYFSVRGKRALLRKAGLLDPPAA